MMDYFVFSGSMIGICVGLLLYIFFTYMEIRSYESAESGYRSFTLKGPYKDDGQFEIVIFSVT